LNTKLLGAKEKNDKKQMKTITIYLGLILFLYSCIDLDTNLKRERVDLHEVNQLYKGSMDLAHRDTIYIPIYSKVPIEHNARKHGLTVTMSIRNTSLRDTIYIEDIDYYNSQGELVRKYLNDIMFLTPMQSTSYVIEESDIEREVEGSFIVNWGATGSKLKPVFQGVMISNHGPQGISFITEGVSVSAKTLR
jgi:hypothetical protein